MSAPSDDDGPEGLTEDRDKLFLKYKLLVPQSQAEDLIDHWHNAQLMHPGRDKLQNDLESRFSFPPDLFRSFEPVLQGMCGLQRHQTSQPVNCWKPTVHCHSGESHEVNLNGCICDAGSHRGRRGL